MQSNNKKGLPLKQDALDKLLSQCPRCKSDNSNLYTRMIKETAEAQLVHSKCGTCQGSLVAVVFTTGPMVSSVGLITDLSEDDVRRIQKQRPLNENDLIDIHEALQQDNICRQLLNA